MTTTGKSHAVHVIVSSVSYSMSSTRIKQNSVNISRITYCLESVSKRIIMYKSPKSQVFNMNSVTCHLAEMTFPLLPKSIKAGTPFSDPGGTQS